jgi:acetylornithine deacetylase/succinyl-diaminopimelate desuccinylase-like protein
LAVLHVEGGRFLTQIPDRAELWLAPGLAGLDAALAAVREACAAERAARGTAAGFDCAAEATELDGTPAVRLAATGRSGHSSEPEAAANALWMLAGVAARLPLAPGGVRTMLAVLAGTFDGDHRGERLGLAYADPQMGPLIAVPTVLRVEDGVVRLRVNMRRPAGRSREEFEASLDEAAARLGAAHAGVVQADERYVGEPYRVPSDAPLVRALLEVYRTETGDPTAEASAIRGGTYARLFPGAVSFGPCAPGVPYRGHAADESLERSQLERTLRVLFEAVVRLAVPPP